MRFWGTVPETDVLFIVYYESIKGDLKRRLIYEYRCDERLKTKKEESTRLADTSVKFICSRIKKKT